MGRPVVDSEAVNVRLVRADLDQLDAWRMAQEEEPSRPEAIRRLLAKALAQVEERVGTTVAGGETHSGHGSWSDDNSRDIIPGWGYAPADKEKPAALVEEGAGVPRAWAEGFARLLPDHPPADVPLKRWKTVIDDVGRFLNGPFLEIAVKLGWGPYDLFGCDRDHPYARIDHMGLLWLLDGRKLVALTETTATIETSTGATYRCWRKPAEPRQCLQWELTAGRVFPAGKMSQPLRD